MEALLDYLIREHVVDSGLVAHAQERAQREGVTVWEALHALDAEFIARALKPKQTYYYHQDVEQFRAARETGQPLNLRAYFPPNLQLPSQQEDAEIVAARLFYWGLIPVAWTEKRVWVVSQRPLRMATALRTLLCTRRRLFHVPAPPEQVEDYHRLLDTYLWQVQGMLGFLFCRRVTTEISPLIRIADTILQQAIHERASAIELEPQPRRLVVRYLTSSDRREALILPPEDLAPTGLMTGLIWADVLTLPEYITQALMLRYKHMAEMRIQLDPVDDFGRVRVRYQNRDYDLAVFTRVVEGREWMYLHFVRESPAPLVSRR